MEKRERSCTVGGNVNGYSHHERQNGDFFKKLGMKSPYDAVISLLGIYPEETQLKKDTCTPVFTEALFTTARTT